MNRQLREMLLKNFGKNPVEGYSFYNAENRMDDVRRYHSALGKSGLGNVDNSEETTSSTDKPIGIIDDITWDDLEMDRVFQTVNHTNSFIGEQVLFHRLHVLNRSRSTGATGSGAKRMKSMTKTGVSREEVISFFDENPDERLNAEAGISYIGKHKEAYHLAEFLINSDLWKLGNTYIFHLLQLLLLTAVVGTVIFHNVIWISGLVSMALINVFVYTIQKMRYEIFFNSLSDFKGVYDAARWLDGRFSDKNFYDGKTVKAAVRDLRKMTYIIMGMNRRRKNAMSGDALSILFEYIWGILLLDISMFNYLMRIIRKNISSVFVLLDFVGEIDSDIAVLSYRKSLNKWCKPEFGETDMIFEGVTHPLIRDAVENDFVLNGRAMITGANASGKSTFMKAVAINCILAQTINTCSAKRICMKPVHIITCMSLRDDIVTGESYYFREARYLKRMLDILVERQDVLIVIDEILKGTNTGERIAASRAVLDYISETGCMALVATHDKELTDNNCYENFYFTGTVSGNDMRFDYLIHSGTTVDTNAIDLLCCLDYPNIIVEKAKRYMNAYRRNS